MNYMLSFKKLKISPFAIFAITILFYADFSVYTLFVILAAVLHEAGHIIAIKAAKCPLSQISVYPFGAHIKADITRVSYKTELWIYLSGPLVNLFMFIIFVALAFGFRFLSRQFLFFGFSNFALFLANILPVKGLDGGKTLECALCLCGKRDLTKIDSLCELLSALAIFLLTLIALLVLHITNYNFSLLIFCAYLVISVYAKNSL